MWDQSDSSLVPWFQQQTLLWAFVPFCNENFCFTIWSSFLFLGENWTRHSLESFTGWLGRSWVSFLASQQRMWDQGCSLCPCGAQLHCWMKVFLNFFFFFFLHSHCVISLPLFTCMSAYWLLCVFQCSNPNCYWSPLSQCSVALQFVLLLTMFNKYVC